ncbi:hypothetical protein COZ71_03775, partial [Candidatus Desantisbacteria bacterium CG_4_8_14_3_um_filter_40_12]
FGMYALYNNTGAYSNGFGMYALQYNNWPNAIKIGHQSTPYFLVNSATDKSFAYADIDGTAHTITYSSAHGFGTVGGKINLKFTLIAGTAPTGLVNGTVYQFTVTSTTVLTYASIISQGSVDFEGKLTNSADITNSIAIGYNVNASKANQVVLGNSNIVETLLNGNIGIQLTSPTSKIHLAAGSVTANTAPLGFTSGALLTVPVPGKVEFLADAWYGTITTGAERKQFAFTSDITAAAHDPVTLGTANGLSLSIQELSLGLASPSITGALSSNDWNTFNTKVGGSGTANYIPKFTGSGTIGNSIIYQLGDSVGIGIETPTAKLAVNGTFVAGDFLDYIGSNLSTKLEVGNNAISLLGAGGSEHIYIGDVDNVGNGNYIDFDQAGYFKIKQPMTAWTYDRSSMFDPNVFFHMKGSLDVYDELGVNIFILENPSSALNGLQAWSPAIQYRGYGYKTNAPAGSQPVDFRSYVITEQGTANPTGYLKFESRVNNGVYANPVVFTTKGGIESMTAKFTTGAGLNYVAVSDAAGLLTWTDPATVLASYVPTSRTLTLSGSGAITIDPSTAVDL